MKNFYAILLLLIAAGPLSAQVAHPVISQVYAGGGNSGASFNADFVELFNPTASPVNLEGWTIQYSSAGGGTWAGRALQGSIEPGRYFLIRMSNEGLTGAGVPLPDLVATPQLALATSGGEVALVQSSAPLTTGCNKEGNVIDLLGYGSAACNETAAATAGTSSKSMHRMNRGCTDTDNNAADFTTATPAPRNSKAQASVCGVPIALPPTQITPVSFRANWKPFTPASSYAIDVLRDGSSMDPALSLLAGWTFPIDGANTEPDAFNTVNNSASITTTAGVITDAVGATTRSASANLWTDGAGIKYWQIRVNATGFSNVRVSSQQRSSGTGPRDFTTEYRIGATGSWMPFIGGSLTLTDDFAEGILTDLALPPSANGSPEVYIRWLMTSNVSVNEGVVSNAGTSRIDNIAVRGNGTINVEFVPGYENKEVMDTTLQVSGLEASRKYYYRVRALANGSMSTSSNTVELTTPPHIPLSVHFLNVKATQHQKGALITWTNPSEMGVVHYNVEASATGASFSPIGQLAPKNNSGDLATYHFLDTVEGPPRWYRITAVETNGEQTRSMVVRWVQRDEGKWEVYPNPAVGQRINLRLNGVPAGRYSISLYNSTGQLVHTSNIVHNGGDVYKVIALNEVKGGIYFLQVGGPVQLKKQIILYPK